MTNTELLQSIPSKRPLAVDGMAVTADIWEEAHDYHRQQMRFHNLLAHGWGILAGLEVIASDPPDRSVYVLPGVAVDPLGRLIVLTQPVAYDIGETQRGRMYLLLTYGESRPRSANGAGQATGPSYIHAEFGIEARASLPDSPWVELARIRRQEASSPALDAQDPLQPGHNEIDMRFRRMVSGTARAVVRVAAVQAGDLPAEHGRGVINLGRTLGHAAAHQITVEANAQLAPGIEENDLIYIAGSGALQLNADERDLLRAYVESGGTVVFEQCRRNLGADDPAPDVAELAAALGAQLAEVQPEHGLLSEPHVFGLPPSGFETGGAARVTAGEGVIFSTCDFGCLWHGQRRDGPASRADIRAAMEWGENLVAYAAGRRKRARQSRA